MKRVLWVALALGLSATAHAKPSWVKKAHAAGYTAEVKDCLTCHTKSSGRILNDRGKFLLEKMKEAGVKDLDFSWVKEYKEPPAEPGAAEIPAADPTPDPSPAATPSPQPQP